MALVGSTLGEFIVSSWEMLAQTWRLDSYATQIIVLVDFGCRYRDVFGAQ
jgi:hypothetical protein